MENRQKLRRLAEGENHNAEDPFATLAITLANGFLALNREINDHSDNVCQSIDKLTEKVAALTEKVELIASVIENHK